MESFHLEIFSPERPFYVGDAVLLTVPVSDGMMGILAHHEPMTAAVMDGEASFKLPDGTVRVCVMSRGMLDISQNDARILCDSVFSPEELDDALEREAAAAEALKEQEKQALRDYRVAQLAFAKAVNTLKNKQKDSMKN
ncbi:MAG: F0F1 ATP synthase subunit epsilon [Lachnospiraceae bacterium]|nr:F0F1 ATP synthase subunit epsilon [Lachnospiraceae bacterium]